MATATKETPRYREVDVRKERGAHFTPAPLADFVADQILSIAGFGEGKSFIRILDPAVGDGGLLLSLVRRFPTTQAGLPEIHGFETDPESLATARSRLQRAFPDYPLSLKHGDFLEFALDRFGEPDLFRCSEGSEDPFDLLIANPPYVRTQVMGATQAQLLARRFGLTGRVDLYHAFINAMALVLRPGGTAGIIVSNRFMTTKSGSSVRRSILEQFDVIHVWDLGDTRLFAAAVLPAVLLLRKKEGRRRKTISARFTSVYSSDSDGPARKRPNLVEALQGSGLVEMENGHRFLVQHGALHRDDALEGIWRISTRSSSGWLGQVESGAWGVFGDIGKIHVGVKTTADRVFIRSDWERFPEDERPELLRPLTTHHVACRFKALRLQDRKQILYPHHSIDGRCVSADLRLYPRAAKYLSKHRGALESREYLRKARRNWYEIWVPQDPDAWGQPKIVFRDIVDEPTFWIDLEGSVVNGDCYWLACRNGNETDLLWLALAVGNSTFLSKFYDYRFHNKLYAGRRRFMTQYVEKFPLPDPESDAGRLLIEMAKTIYHLSPSEEGNHLQQDLDRQVYSAFGLQIEEVPR